MRECVKKREEQMTISDKIDRVVTNRAAAIPIFIGVMFLVYFISVSWLGTIVTDWTNDVLFGEWISGWRRRPCGNRRGRLGRKALSWTASSAVGAITGFVPQMLILFLLLALLEDCGYMARVAFIMDRIFRKFGLSGKSFIPMLGCFRLRRSWNHGKPYD